MQKLLVIDYGSQYTHLITSRFRNLGIYTEITPALDDLSKDDLANLKSQIDSGILKGIILSGGPNSVYDKNTLTLPKEFFSLNIPILSICYGHQLTHFVNGGNVEQGETQEYGEAKMKFSKNSRLFENINSENSSENTSENSDEIVVWMSHGDEVTELGEGFKSVGKTSDCFAAATENSEKNIFTLQFHPEVAHTQNGEKILENFAKITGVEKNWSMEKFLEFELEELKKNIGDKNIFLFISGGVDSTVAYFLINKAIGPEKIFPVFVNTGFMRKNESEKVKNLLETAGVKNFKIVNAKKDFLKDLENISEPEVKRKIIGNKFIQIQAEVAKEYDLNPEKWLLAQGTIYPDTIESGGTKNSQTIKTHHNRVPEIEEMIKKGLVIEPLAKLYKDEVRQIGKLLGISDELVYRHPFPGPGLALRILCNDLQNPEENFNYEESEINKFLENKFEKNNSSEVEENKKFSEKNNSTKIFSAKNNSTKNFSAKILPIKSVGVQGDNRNYKHPVLINGNFSNWEELNKISTSLTNNFFSINRVLLNLSGDKSENFSEKKSEEKYFLKKGFLTDDRIKILQEIDAIVENFLIEKNYLRKIWQFPVVILPLNEDGKKESIVLRPISSTDAMTASPSKINFQDLEDLVSQILENDNISSVFYDLTGKPPGTIEWE